MEHGLEGIAPVHGRLRSGASMLRQRFTGEADRPGRDDRGEDTEAGHRQPRLLFGAPPEAAHNPRRPLVNIQLGRFGQCRSRLAERWTIRDTNRLTERAKPHPFGAIFVFAVAGAVLSLTPSRSTMKRIQSNNCSAFTEALP